jgi:hypothetical protein
MLSRPPFNDAYEFKMFRTVHGNVFSPYDAIIVDDGTHPFTVESYLTRDHAFAARENALKLHSLKPQRRKGDLDYSPSEKSDKDAENEDQLENPLQTRSFTDLAELYHGRNFAQLAKSTETLINKANSRISALKNHLHAEGGMSVIRVRNPATKKLVAKRCILLPSTALDTWRRNLNIMVKERLDECFTEFSSNYMTRYHNYDEMLKLFYFQRIGMDAPERESFQNVPLWKMEVMLKKWRTERALQEWIDNYKYR